MLTMPDSSSPSIPSHPRLMFASDVIFAWFVLFASVVSFALFAPFASAFLLVEKKKRKRSRSHPSKTASQTKGDVWIRQLSNKRVSR